MNEFDDIIGYDATKEELVRIADTLKTLSAIGSLA